jgi:twinkle protein
MTINGFEIDVFNQYSFPENARSHTCPVCSHTRKKKTQKCLSIYWSSGLAKCAHCGEILQLHTFKKRNNDNDKNYVIPEWENNTKLSDNAVKWFEKRGISQFVLRLMKIGEGVHFMPPNSKEEKGRNKNTIQFPYFRNGEIVDIKYRAGDKTFNLYKGAERMAYNLDNIQSQDIIYCVEGEMDVLAVMESGLHNVTSPPNGFTSKGNVNLDWLNNDVDHFLNAEKIILAFDQDEPGQNGTKEFIRRFGAHKCFLVDLKDCKDSNDYLLKYGREALKKALETHIEIPLENVSTYNDCKENVRDFFINGMPQGYVTGTMPNLDKIFSVNSSQPILVTGIPSMGKSEVVDQIVLSWIIKYGFKAAYASPENKPNVLHFQKIMRKLLGSVPKEKSHFNKAFEACEAFVEDNIYMIDIEKSYTLEKVLLKAEELVYRKGIKILVIDPFNKVRCKEKIDSVTGNRINDYTNHYLTRIYDFCVKYDIIPIIVAHPNKMEKDGSGKRVIPDFYDVKGGGEWYDMMPHGLAVHRDFDLNITIVKTLKVKFAHLGDSNKECYFKYNLNNGRLDPIKANSYEDIANNNFEILWNNNNWITNTIDNVTQQELKDLSNKDLTYNPDEWLEKGGENETAPF